MKTLSDWLAWARQLEDIYQQELGRSCFSDPEAFVNWTWHRANGQTPGWIRERIRESDEWRERHAQAPPPPPQPPPAAPRPPAQAGRVLKVTDGTDGEFHPRFYSYWSNAWVTPDGGVLVFAGGMDGRPRFWRVDMNSGSAERLGTLLRHTGTTEGWSWLPDGRIALVSGPELLHAHPFTGQQQVIADISAAHPGCRLWQSHSDGDVHCATVERITSSGPYERIGTLAVRHGEQMFYPATGVLDESQVCGDYLIIKETRHRNGRDRLDNRIVNLATGEDQWLLDEEGAVGHSDCWNGLLAGEDDQRGACVLHDLDTIGRTWGAVTQQRILFNTWRMGHLSFRAGALLNSSADAYLHIVPLDGSGPVQFVEHGNTGDPNDYDNQVRANLDPTGRVACWMSNAAGRRDVYLAKLP